MKRTKGFLTSATSFWKVSVMEVRPYLKGPSLFGIAFSHCISKGIETENGRLPTIRRSESLFST